MKIFRKIAGSRTFVTTFAAVALVAAQVVVINHDLSPENHTPDSFCEFCVAGAGLAGANVGDAKAPVIVSVSLRIPDAVQRVHSNVPLRYHFARAPPTAS